jgi:hypothetical protein
MDNFGENNMGRDEGKFRMPSIETTSERARRFRVHPETIRRQVRRGELKPVQGFKPYRFWIDGTDGQPQGAGHD